MAAALMRLDTSLRNGSSVATKGRFLAARPVSRSPMKRYAEATAAKLWSSFMSTATTGRYFDQDSDHAFFVHPAGHSAAPKASWIAWAASLSSDWMIRRAARASFFSRRRTREKLAIEVMSAPTMTPMSPNTAATPSASASIDLPQNSDDSSSSLRMHRQHVDDVRPVVASPDAVAD